MGFLPAGPTMGRTASALRGLLRGGTAGTNLRTMRAQPCYPEHKRLVPSLMWSSPTTPPHKGKQGNRSINILGRSSSVGCMAFFEQSCGLEKQERTSQAFCLLMGKAANRVRTVHTWCPCSPPF